MKLSDAFPSNYLKSDDLNGNEVTVTIADVAMKQVGDDTRLVLSFVGKKKEMICNKTNASRIAAQYGDDTDDWDGKEITLGSEFVEFQGKTVQGLRVKMPAKKTSHKAVSRGKFDVMEKADPEDEIPF